MRYKRVSKITLAVSLILLFIWLAMGTTSSIAWFREEDELINSLYFGDMDIKMYHLTGSGYELIDESTAIFGDEDLYEPGFTKIAYLKIENAGGITFKYDISVVPDTSSTVLGTNAMGNSIDLADYIKFGIYSGETEEDVMEKTSDRKEAKKIAVHDMSDYTEEGMTLSSGETAYAAVVIYLPEETDNTANYRGDTAPEISFGISAIANQVAE